jgi:hypothetical protein
MMEPSSQSQTHADRRMVHNPRVPIDTAVMLSYDDALASAFDADAINISDGGLLLRAAEAPPLGSIVRCRFECPPTGESVQVSGEVVWVRSDDPLDSSEREFGVRFTHVPFEDAQRIADLSDGRLNQPSRVDLNLFLEGVSTPLRAFADNLDTVEVTAEQMLDFLKLGTAVRLQSAQGDDRRGYIRTVRLELVDNVPKLMLRISGAQPTPTSTVTSTSTESPMTVSSTVSEEHDDVLHDPVPLVQRLKQISADDDTLLTHSVGDPWTPSRFQSVRPDELYWESDSTREQVGETSDSLELAASQPTLPRLAADVQSSEPAPALMAAHPDLVETLPPPEELMLDTAAEDWMRQSVLFRENLDHTDAASSGDSEPSRIGALGDPQLTQDAAHAEDVTERPSASVWDHHADGTTASVERPPVVPALSTPSRIGQTLARLMVKSRHATRVAKGRLTWWLRQGSRGVSGVLAPLGAVAVSRVKSVGGRVRRTVSLLRPTPIVSPALEAPRRQQNKQQSRPQKLATGAAGSVSSDTRTLRRARDTETRVDRQVRQGLQVDGRAASQAPPTDQPKDRKLLWIAFASVLAMAAVYVVARPAPLPISTTPAPSAVSSSATNVAQVDPPALQPAQPVVPLPDEMSAEPSPTVTTMQDSPSVGQDVGPEVGQHEPSTHMPDPSYAEGQIPAANQPAAPPKVHVEAQPEPVLESPPRLQSASGASVSRRKSIASSSESARAKSAASPSVARSKRDESRAVHAARETSANSASSAVAAKSPSMKTTTSFGAKTVARGRSYLIRMSGPVEGLQGVALPDGFRVTVPGALALDKASPLAAAVTSVQSAKIRNRGDHAELTVQFKPDRTPKYRVVAKGAALEVIIER